MRKVHGPRDREGVADGGARRQAIPAVSDLRIPKVWLAAILAAAFLLRVGGILWGIPTFDPYENLYHPDEYRQVVAAAAFPRDVPSRLDLRNPTFLPYLAGAVALPFRLAASAFWGRPMQETRDVAWLVARSISLLFALGGILATFLLARRMAGDAAGLVAAGLIAVASYHVQVSVWATGEAASACLMVVAMLLILRLLDHRRPRDYLFAGIVVGLLVGTRYTAIIIAAPILFIAVRIWREEGRRAFSQMVWGMAFLAAVAVGTFLITTPTIVLRPDSLMWSIASLRADFEPFVLPITDVRSWNILFDSLGQAMGMPMFLFVAAGMIAAIVRRPWPRELAPILCAIGAFFLAFIPAGLNQLHPRYLVMILPLLIVVASGGGVRLARHRSFFIRAGMALAGLIVIVPSLIYSAWAVVLRWDDPRSEAAAFIEREIPAGSSVGYGDIGDYRCWSWFLPKIDTTRYEIVDPLIAPDYLILSSFCTSPLLDVLQDPNRTLDAPSRTTPLMWGRLPWVRFPKLEVFQLMEDVLLGKGERYRYHLVRSFGKSPPPVAMEFPPPEIRIYQKKGDVSHSEIPRNN